MQLRSEKLNDLADWLDIYDAERGVTDQNEVQQDLREMAKIFEYLEESEELGSILDAMYY